MTAQPTALAFAHPFEGRTSYFLAGLSHFYQLDIYYTPSKRFRFAWQTFYRWQYSKDICFIKTESLDDVFQSSLKYEAAFIFREAVEIFHSWLEKQDEILELRSEKAIES